MTSLTEVYEGNAREVSSLRRLYAGTALVLAGAGLALVALLLATTDLFGSYLAGEFTARTYSGVLGGLAAPVVLVGVFVVLPAGRRTRAAAAISASICVLGVALFWYAYPSHWDGHGQDLTLFVSAVYLVGFFSAVWSLFAAIANFKTRNDPGGALELNVTRKGETRIVEVENPGGVSGVGLLGATPDGEVDTQTNAAGQSTSAAPSPQPTSDSSTRNSAGASTRPKTGSPTSDGGSTETAVSSPLDDPGGHDS